MTDRPTATGAVGFCAALAPFLEGRAAAASEDGAPGVALDVALVVEQLVSFARHHGLAVEDERGRPAVVAPAASFGPELAWGFVADHLVSRVSLPVARLRAAARLVADALEDAAERGVEPVVLRQSAAATRRAARELARLDRLARGLRALPRLGRPSRTLWRRDREAYAAAMRAWEASRPRADEELEGGFAVRAACDEGLALSHPDREHPLLLALPAEVRSRAREGDRLDVLVGRSGDTWFVVDAFAAAAPRPPAAAHGPGASQRARPGASARGPGAS